MDRLLHKPIYIIGRTLFLCGLGYTLDVFMGERFEWAVWLLLGAVIMPFSLLQGRLFRHLLDRMHKDSLTGLRDKGFFYIKLNSELSKVKKGEYPVSFLMIDIDDFKVINDTYGHVTGDKVLKQLACILRQSTRNSDIVARWGGEEFAIILPDTAVEGAYNLAERIRGEVEKSEFCCEGALCKITVSVGVASINNDAIDTDSFVKLADMALYKAKEKKNQVVCAGNMPAFEKVC